MAKTKTKKKTKAPILKPKFDREDMREYNKSGRFYVLPDGGDTVKYPSVTSVIGGGVPKPALMGWAGKYAAEFAVKNLEMVEQMVGGEGDQGAVDWIKGASGRYTRQAGMEGSAVHNFAEEYFHGFDPDPEDFFISDRSEEMMKQVIHFIHAIKPRMLHVEPLLYSKEHGYAGAADFIAKVKNPELLKLWRWKKKRQPVVLFDFKTSNSGIYPEVALQLAAYAHSDTLLTMDGKEHEMPAIDLAAAVHIREDSWSIQPLVIDDYVFDAFLAAMTVSEFQKSTDNWRGTRKVVGNPIARGGAE